MMTMLEGKKINELLGQLYPERTFLLLSQRKGAEGCSSFYCGSCSGGPSGSIIHGRPIRIYAEQQLFGPFFQAVARHLEVWGC